MKNTIPDISVVMPVYNVEGYIERCIESVIKQTFENFELIIIDDGSTDKSGIICDKYKDIDNRIKVNHIKNGGVSNARNIGIKNAVGKYIFFIDSDDYIDPDMLSSLYENAEKNEVELVISGFYMDYIINDKTEKYRVFSEDCIYDSLNKFVENAYEYIKTNLINTPWNKLYLNNVIKDNNLLFEKRFGEDLFFNIEYLKHINKISIISDSNYNWNRTREGSETDLIYKDSNRFLQEKYAIFEKIMELYSFVGLDNIDNKRKVYNYYAGRLVQFVQELSSNKQIDRKTKKSIIKDMLNDEKTKSVLKIVKADSLMMGICYIPLKLRAKNLTFIMGCFINSVRKNFKKLFYNLRSNKINNANNKKK